MELHHLVLSTVQREPLFLYAHRRLAVRTLARVVGVDLWGFALVDDHLHAVVRGDRPTVLGGHVALALGALPDAPPLQPAWAEPVTDRAHLKRLVNYLLRQPEHHGLGASVGWEGTCFLDWVGAGRLDGFDGSTWRDSLPREDLPLVWEAVRAAAPPGVPASGQPLDGLVRASARALAVDADLSGRTDRVVRARHAAVALAVEAGFRAESIAPAVSAAPRTVRRLATTAPDPDDLRAARRSLALAVAFGAASDAPPTEGRPKRVAARTLPDVLAVGRP